MQRCINVKCLLGYFLLFDILSCFVRAGSVFQASDVLTFYFDCSGIYTPSRKIGVVVFILQVVKQKRTKKKKKKKTAG